MSTPDADATLLHDLGHALEHIIRLYEAMPQDHRDNMPLLLAIAIGDVGRARVRRYRGAYPPEQTDGPQEA